jgi:hypothetical protein
MISKRKNRRIFAEEAGRSYSSCSEFKDISPCIVQHDPNAATSLCAFKQAFDILRHLEPSAIDDNPNNVISLILKQK